MFIILIFLINAVFRGAGDSSLAMRSLWLANAINLVLDPCLIFGWGPFPELGVAGAAWATNTGRAIGVVYQLWHLTKGSGRIHVGRGDRRLDLVVCWRLFRLSVWGVVQFLLATSSWVFLMRIVAQFGSEVLAGYTIAIRLVMFTFLPAWGFSNSAATLVGQNLGAGDPDRAEAAVWLTGKTNTLFMTMIGVLFFAIPEWFIGFFSEDPIIVASAVTCLKVLSVGYPLYAMGMVLVQSFNGAGDTMSPTIINLWCYWAAEIPLAWTLAMPLGLGPKGVFMAIVVAESLVTVVGYLVFVRGRWKLKRV